MNRKKELIIVHSLLGLLVLSCMFVSCAQDEKLNANGYVPAPGELQVDANISSNIANETRAVYMHGHVSDQRYFLDSAALGVSVVDATTGGSYGGGQLNKKFMVHGGRDDTYNSQYIAPEGSANAIGLLAGGAKACGYFPYRSDVTDIEKIHWEQNPYNDIMYSKWTLSTSPDLANPGTNLPLTEKTPICNMTFQHAQSILVFIIRNEGYNDKAYVTHVTVKGGGFGTKADLNAGTGVLSNVTDTTFSQSYNPPLIFKVDSVKDMFYVFPNEQEKRIDFSFTIDDIENNAHGLVTLKQGNIYYFRFKMTSVKLVFEGVSIVPWNSAGIEAVESRPYIYTLDNQEYVDMGMTDVYGNKILWAKNNLGASDSTGIGNYYMWGQTHPYSPQTNIYYRVGPKYYFNEDLGFNSISTTQYDAARATWGNENRMPTRYEWDYLSNASYYRWVDTTVVNRYGVGVKGYKVVNKADPRRTLFFPYTGFRTYNLKGLGSPIPQDTIDVLSSDVTKTGYYWTGSQAVNVLPYQPIYLKMGVGSRSGYNTTPEAQKDSVAYPIRAVKIWRKYDNTPFQ